MPSVLAQLREARHCLLMEMDTDSEAPIAKEEQEKTALQTALHLICDAIETLAGPEFEED